jgi:hypothetical protein
MRIDPATAEKHGGWLQALRQPGIGALSLLAANAALLVFYFVYGLSLFQLVLVFWAECLWIGLFSALRLITASLLGEPYENRRVGMSRGAAVLTSVVIIGLAGGAFFSLLGLMLLAILAAIEMLPQSTASDDGLELIRIGLGVSVLFLISHSISFFINFLALGEFRIARVGGLVALPFWRCLALLAALLISFVAVLFIPQLASTAGFGAGVIVVKLAFDLRLHLKEHRAFDIMQRSRR